MIRKNLMNSGLWYLERYDTLGLIFGNLQESLVI